MKRRPRFSLKVLMLFVAAAGIFCAYHVHWIRQRHEFLARNARNAPYDGLLLTPSTRLIQHVDGTYNRKTPKHSFNFLWLFWEPPQDVVRLDYMVDEAPLGFLGNKQVLEMVPNAQEECELGERLFPESDFRVRIMWDYHGPLNVIGH